MCKTPLKNIRAKEADHVQAMESLKFTCRFSDGSGGSNTVSTKYLTTWRFSIGTHGRKKENRPLKIAFPEFTDQWLSHGSRHSIHLFVFVQWLIRRICKIVVLALKSLKIFSLTLENFQSLILPSFRCFFSLSCFENSNFFLKRNFPKIVL